MARYGLVKASKVNLWRSNRSKETFTHRGPQREALRGNGGVISVVFPKSTVFQ
jgi:hypothetical protein